MHLEKPTGVWGRWDPSMDWIGRRQPKQGDRYKAAGRVHPEGPAPENRLLEETFKLGFLMPAITGK